MSDNTQRMCEILTRLGLAHSNELVSRLGIERELDDDKKIGLLAAGERHPLGVLLHLVGRITNPQLTSALDEQARNGKRLGKVLVSRGLIDEPELKAALAFQRGQNGKVRHSKKLKLGNLGVVTGEITQVQLDQALVWQAMYGGKLGATLVNMGYVNRRQIKKILQLQGRLLVGLLALIMTLAPTSVMNKHAGEVVDLAA